MLQKSHDVGFISYAFILIFYNFLLYMMTLNIRSISDGDDNLVIVYYCK
jgi:hypothetical protein